MRGNVARSPDPSPWPLLSDPTAGEGQMRWTCRPRIASARWRSAPKTGLSTENRFSTSSAVACVMGGANLRGDRPRPGALPGCGSGQAGGRTSFATAGADDPPRIAASGAGRAFLGHINVSPGVVMAETREKIPRETRKRILLIGRKHSGAPCLAAPAELRQRIGVRGPNGRSRARCSLASDDRGSVSAGR